MASSNDSQQGRIAKKVNGVLNAITPAEKSVLQQRIQKEQRMSKSAYGLLFDRPTYVLPYYYTTSPYESIYTGETPDNQSVKRQELKAQISLKWLAWHHMMGSANNLGVSYTQLFYWQVYARSSYFRESNYEPAVFISNNFHRNWMSTVGLVHQSNGRGGTMERTWNRAYVDLAFSGSTWYVSIKPWISVLRNATKVHNPDIIHYMGDGRLLFAYQNPDGEQVAFMMRNAFESCFKRGGYQLSYSLPIAHRSIRFYVQAFTGYGQSLIEYNHRTTGVGIGLAFSDWIISHNAMSVQGPQDSDHR